MESEIIDIQEPKKKITKPTLTKTLITQQLRQRVSALLVEEAEPIIRAQIKAAVGGYFNKTTFRNSQGDIDKTIEQQQDPNVQAAKFLFETVIGRPTETVQHSGAIGLVALVRKLEADDAGERGDTF